MVKSWLVAAILAIGAFLIDQHLKFFFIDGLRMQTQCIDLTLIFNKGVAFSMFAFLGEWLKWIQLVLIFGLIGYTVMTQRGCYLAPLAMMIGAALSNLLDRFIYGGVVDYVYWHCGFEFPIFNAADVMIDLAIVWLLVLQIRPQLCAEHEESIVHDF